MGAALALAESEGPGSMDVKREKLADFRKVVALRLAEEAEFDLKHDNQAPFAINGAGTETCALVLSKKIKKGDVVRGYYRDAPLAIACNVISIKEKLAGVLGNVWDDEEGQPFDPASGGRQMGNHIGSRIRDENGDLVENLEDNVIWLTQSSPTGSQMPVALGAAKAQKLKNAKTGSDNVAVVTIGDASMAEGIAWETLNQAVVQELPLVCVCYDNEFGISVPGDMQIAHNNVSRALSGMAPADGETKGLKIIGPVDGSDEEDLEKATDEAFKWAREHSQPAFVHVKITQPHDHSSSGSAARYKGDERLKHEKENDPVMRMRKKLMDGEVATEPELQQIIDEEIEKVDKTKAEAWKDFYSPVKKLGEEAINKLNAFGNDVTRFGEVLDANGADSEAVIRVLNKTRGDIAKAMESGSIKGKYGQALRVSNLHQFLKKVLIDTNSTTLKALRSRKELARFVLDIEKEMDQRINGHVYAEGERSPLNVARVIPIFRKGPEGKVAEDSTSNILAVGYKADMQRDQRVVIMGEDAGLIGGVNGTTLGLQGGLEQVIKGTIATLGQEWMTLRKLSTFETKVVEYNPLRFLMADKREEIPFQLPNSVIQKNGLMDKHNLVQYLRGLLVENGKLPTAKNEADQMVEIKLSKEDVGLYFFRGNPAILRYFKDEDQMISTFKGLGIGRIWDSAIAEATIVGESIGMALLGKRPIAEIQYLDYVIYALQQIVDEMARVRHSTRGGQICPAIVKTSGHQLLGMWHSGSPMMKLIEAGLRLVCGRNGTQTVGMMRACLKGDDPAIVVEPLLKVTGGKEPVPDNLEEVCIPLGESEVLKEGSDLTIVTYGECCYSALDAAKELEAKFGITVEVVDLQTLNPIDVNGVAKKSIAKTGKLLVLDEDIPGGASSYIYNKLMLANMPNEEGTELREKVINYTEVSDCLTGPECKPSYAGFEGRYWTKPNQYKIIDKVLAMMKGVASVEKRADFDIYGLE